MIKADSVLELLAGERIFSVEVSPSKRDIYFTEMNGMSYIASLNKLGLGKLIDETSGYKNRSININLNK